MHHPSTLVRLKKKLSVRRTIQDDQFLRLRSAFVLRTNARKASAAIVGVITGYDKQGARFQLFCRQVRRCAEKYDAINLTRCRLDRRVAGGSAKAPPTTDTVLAPRAFK